MKRFVLFAAGLTLFASDLAIAQHQAQGQPQQRPRPDRPTTKPAPPHVRPVGPGNGHRPGVRPPTTKPAPPYVRPVRPGDGHRPGVRPPGNGHRPGVRPPGDGHRPGIRPPGNWHRPPHRPGFRPPNFRPIRGPAFRWPRGYRYHRWTAGVLLPSLFLGSAYYYDDYATLGFGAPPPGYRWVRYGPDLVLVNLRTRRVRDVIYGAFY